MRHDLFKKKIEQNCTIVVLLLVSSVHIIKHFEAFFKNNFMKKTTHVVQIKKNIGYCSGCYNLTKLFHFSLSRFGFCRTLNPKYRRGPNGRLK